MLQDWMNPVSYTHLDVYKRQPQQCSQRFRQAGKQGIEKRLAPGSGSLVDGNGDGDPFRNVVDGNGCCDGDRHAGFLQSGYKGGKSLGEIMDGNGPVSYTHLSCME